MKRRNHKNNKSGATFNNSRNITVDKPVNVNISRPGPLWREWAATQMQSTQLWRQHGGSVVVLPLLTRAMTQSTYSCLPVFRRRHAFPAVFSTKKRSWNYLGRNINTFLIFPIIYQNSRTIPMFFPLLEIPV